MVFSESAIKKGKFVTKIFFTITLYEEVLKSCAKITRNSFEQLFPKGKIFSFGGGWIFLFWKNHLLLEDTKFKLLLWMSLVFRASTNVSFSGNNHILKFFIRRFKILPSSFFFKFWKSAITYWLSDQEVSFRHSKQDGR